MAAVAEPRLADPAGVKRARRAVVGDHDSGRLAELLRLLADPTRLRILFALGAVEELCVRDLAAATETNEDAAGYGLKLLRKAGLVQGRRNGRSVRYRLAKGFPQEMLEHCLHDLLAIRPDTGPKTRTRSKTDG